jgi:adenylate cyclase
VAAFSFPFSSSDNQSIRLVDEIGAELIGNAPDINQRLAAMRSTFDFDTKLEKALEKRQVMLGYTFDNSARVEAALPLPLDFHYADSSSSVNLEEMRAAARQWHFYRGYTGNLPRFLGSAAGSGFINTAPDNDGLVRRVPLVAKHAGGYYESLALALLRRAETPGVVLRPLVDSNVRDGVVQILSTGRLSSPINNRGEMYLNFMGVGGSTANFENTRSAVFRYVSAVDFINGEVPRDYLTDKIVLIGSSSDALRDVYSTPLNSKMPGVELLATQIANIINDEVLHRNPNAAFWETAILMLAALTAAVVFLLMGPLLSFVLTVLLCVGTVLISLSLWSSQLEIVRMTQPLLVFIGLFLWNSISGFVFEWRASRNLQDSFGQYVPPEVAKRIGQQHSITMEGESRIISVLFSDVRNFTAISEGFSPQELTQLMNRMLTALSEVVHLHGGTEDKFIGDAEMAFWNAPLDNSEHAKNAILSAIDMQKAMQSLSRQLESEGHPCMSLGVGICTGEANVGNMGSTLRIAYTAMGDTVNVASRVEGLTRYYKVPTIVTESTRTQCTGVVFRSVDKVQVKGRVKSLDIFEPWGEEHQLPPEKLRALEMYEKMYAAYQAGDFSIAAEKLSAYQEMEPDDELAGIYQERIEKLIRQAPSEWNGITNFEVK